MLQIAFIDDAPWAQPFVERYLSQITDYAIMDESDFSRKEPDIAFYSDGKKHTHLKLKNSKRVFITCEDLYPDFSVSDYVVAHQHLNFPRYLRIPFWALITRPEQFIKPDGFADQILAEDRKFCAFVQSNGNKRRTRRRIEFFHALGKRRFVHSGGRVLNNIGYRVTDIHQFLKEFRFAMCFENSASPGYTTEKLTNALLNGCIPIYWGDPTINADFNSKCFINVSDFRSDKEAIDHIEKVADSPELQRSYLSEPFFPDNQLPAVLASERIIQFFKRIVEEPKPKRSLFSIGAVIFKLKHRCLPYLPKQFGVS